MSGRTELPGGLVTFMFTDIEGSTRLARMLGDTYGSVLGAHRALLRAALSDFDGVELFTEGDSFFVAFREASSALAACVAAQRRLSAHDWPERDLRVTAVLGVAWAIAFAARRGVDQRLSRQPPNWSEEPEPKDGIDERHRLRRADPRGVRPAGTRAAGG